MENKTTYGPGTYRELRETGARFSKDPVTKRARNHILKSVSRKVGCVLTSHEVHFVYLSDNFTVQFLNLLKVPSGMENKTAQRAR